MVSIYLFMRIYIDNFNFKMSSTDKIKPYKRDSYQQVYIYSPSGVFRVDKGHNLRKIEFRDGKIENIQEYIKGIHITIDHSIIKKQSHIVSHIPFDNISRKIQLSHYSVQENSPVQLILEHDENGNICEMYFILNSKKYASYSNADIENPLIKEDVEFLLNLIKYK